LTLAALQQEGRGRAGKMHGRAAGNQKEGKRAAVARAQQLCSQQLKVSRQGYKGIA